MTDKDFAAALSECSLAGRVRVMLAMARHRKREQKELMTTGEIAHHFDCCVGTVRLWIERGWLKVERWHGNHRLIRRKDVTAFTRPKKI